MELKVTDRLGIEEGMVLRTLYVVISIRDPGTRKPIIPRTAGLRGILFLAFDDAEPPRDGSVTAEKIRLMSKRDAVTIWQFIRQHQDNVGTIVCHCEQGASRSPAVAIALAEALQADTSEIVAYTSPNSFVYQLMKETMSLETK